MTDRLAADEAGIARAAQLLGDGLLVAFPTDTVYGVACAASHPQAVDDIYVLKRRPTDRRIPILTASLQSIGSEWQADDRAHRLAEAFWPGALTLVLPGPDGRSQAFRAPDHPIALALIAAAGPLYTTSANVSDEPETLDADDVFIAFATQGEGLAAVVDGGRVPGGVASTVLDLASVPARILREGPIDRDQLGRVVEVGD